MALGFDKHCVPILLNMSVSDEIWEAYQGALKGWNPKLALPVRRTPKPMVWPRKQKKSKRGAFQRAHPELYNRDELAALRQCLIERYGEKCMACGSVSHIVLEHIQSRRYKGTNDLANLQLLCRTCNIKKGHKVIDYRPYVD